MYITQCAVVTFAAPKTAPRIVGGDEADAHSHPWQASLQLRESHICGASIISEEWLVTAAHCVDGWVDKRSVFRVLLGKFSVYVL